MESEKIGDEINQCLQIIVTNAGNIKDDRNGPILEECIAIESAVERAAKAVRKLASAPPAPASERELRELTAEWRQHGHSYCAAELERILSRSGQGEPLREWCRNHLETYLYNPFEPDNQSRAYKELKALLTVPAVFPQPAAQLTAKEVQEVADDIVGKCSHLLSDKYSNTQKVVAGIIAQEFNAALAAQPKEVKEGR